MQRFYADLMWVGGTLAAGLLGWALVRHGAVPNERAAVELALQHATLADLESITVYPLLPAAGERAARPYQLHTPAQLHAALPALRQLRPVALATGAPPMLDATVEVRLAAAPATTWHLHSRAIILRLATAPAGEVAQLAQTNTFYQAAALHRVLAHVRDSLIHR
jgi:hypothetical protein